MAVTPTEVVGPLSEWGQSRAENPGETMYRLEDDQDTPSDIPKSGLSTTERKQAVEAPKGKQETETQHQISLPFRRKSLFARPDIKGFLWKITTPNKAHVKHRGLVLA